MAVNQVSVAIPNPVLMLKINQMAVSFTNSKGEVSHPKFKVYPFLQFSHKHFDRCMLISHERQANVSNK